MPAADTGSAKWSIDRTARAGFEARNRKRPFSRTVTSILRGLLICIKHHISNSGSSQVIRQATRFTPVTPHHEGSADPVQLKKTCILRVGDDSLGGLAAVWKQANRMDRLYSKPGCLTDMFSSLIDSPKIMHSSTLEDRIRKAHGERGMNAVLPALITVPRSFLAAGRHTSDGAQLGQATPFQDLAICITRTSRWLGKQRRRRYRAAFGPPDVPGTGN